MRKLNEYYLFKPNWSFKGPISKSMTRKLNIIFHLCLLFIKYLIKFQAEMT